MRYVNPRKHWIRRKFFRRCMRFFGRLFFKETAVYPGWINSQIVTCADCEKEYIIYEVREIYYHPDACPYCHGTMATSFKETKKR